MRLSGPPQPRVPPADSQPTGDATAVPLLGNGRRKRKREHGAGFNLSFVSCSLPLGIASPLFRPATGVGFPPKTAYKVPPFCFYRSP